MLIKFKEVYMVQKNINHACFRNCNLVCDISALQRFEIYSSFFNTSNLISQIGYKLAHEIKFRYIFILRLFVSMLKTCYMVFKLSQIIA